MDLRLLAISRLLDYLLTFDNIDAMSGRLIYLASQQVVGDRGIFFFLMRKSPRKRLNRGEVAAGHNVRVLKEHC